MIQAISIFMIFIVILIVILFWIWTRYESAEANQWLIHIRKGQAIEAGIGIQVWRRPSDTIARFTSTMQRVTFETQVYTFDKQSIQIEGFILWSVSHEEGAAFRAFSKLGITHQKKQFNTKSAEHHALNRPQHHAFRRSVEAITRKSSVFFPLQDILSAPNLLSEKISSELEDILQEWGVSLESVELNEISVIKKELFNHLQAPYIEKSRQESEKIKLLSETNITKLQLAQELEQSRKQAETKRQKELDLSQIELEKERKLAEFWEEEISLKQQKLDRELAWQQKKMKVEHQQKLEILKLDLERKKQQEKQEIEISLLKEERKTKELEAEIIRLKQQQEAQLLHQEAWLALEKDKPESMRSAELSKIIIESASNALESLPIQDIRWFSNTAEQGPSGLLLGLVDTLQQLIPSQKIKSEH